MTKGMISEGMDEREITMSHSINDQEGADSISMTPLALRMVLYDLHHVLLLIHVHCGWARHRDQSWKIRKVRAHAITTVGVAES